MNLNSEHGQSILACKPLGWVTLEEHRAQLKARLMYKIVNGLAPQRLYEAFHNVNEFLEYELRGDVSKNHTFAARLEK